MESVCSALASIAVFTGCYSALVCVYQLRTQKQTTRRQSVLKGGSVLTALVVIYIAGAAWGLEYGIPIVLGVLTLAAMLCIYFAERHLSSLGQSLKIALCVTVCTSVPMLLLGE